MKCSKIIYIYCIRTFESITSFATPGVCSIIFTVFEQLIQYHLYQSSHLDLPFCIAYPRKVRNVEDSTEWWMEFLKNFNVGLDYTNPQKGLMEGGKLLQEETMTSTERSCGERKTRHPRGIMIYIIIARGYESMIPIMCVPWRYPTAHYSNWSPTHTRNSTLLYDNTCS